MSAAATLPLAALPAGPDAADAPGAECRVWLFRAQAASAAPRPRGRVWTRAARRRLARSCIARYLGLRRTQVQISHTSQGQPVVELPAHAARPVAVSLSDSGDTLAVAVMAGAPDAGGMPPRLGIDIEPWQGRAVAATPLPWLSPGESAAIAAAPDPTRRAHFVAIWTQKEACLKALGLGLDAGLARFEVQPDPAAPAAARVLEAGSAAWPALHLQRLHTDHLAGALACDRAPVRVHVTHHHLSTHHRSTQP